MKATIFALFTVAILALLSACIDLFCEQESFFTAIYFTLFLCSAYLGAILHIKGKISTNAGANYDAAIDIAANPNVDEYWFDLNFFPGGGFDLSYYSAESSPASSASGAS